MSARFARVGLGFRFSPNEVPAALFFSRVADHRDEVTAQVEVFNAQGHRVITRRINLMSSPTRGSVKELIDELNGDYHADWRTLLREACQSVLISHASGRPVECIEGEIVRPPPPEWLCRGLLLKNKPNCWLGAASTGKSTLAKAICAYYASGYRFCDREMERGVPLYLDWEDDRAGFERVIYDVCRNLGVWPLPRMLWRDMHGYRLRDQIETLGQIIDREHVGLVVLDAIAAAGGSPGEHMSWEGVALELEQCLGALPAVTVLGLDHVTSAQHQDNGLVPLKARGAERKVEFFRNQWSLIADRQAGDEGRHLVAWNHTKINVAAREQPFVTEIIHRDAEISVELRELESSGDAFERLSELQKLLRLLKDGPQTSAELSEALYGTKEEKKAKIVRVQMGRAKSRGLVGQDANGRWYLRNIAFADGQLIPFPGGAA